MRWLRKAFEAGEETEAGLEGLRQVVLASAESGSPEAQSAVAEWFFQGQVVARDTVAAAAWLQKAADQGFPLAIHRLAMLYERGEGVPADSAAALSLHRRAAEAGQREAQYRLGYMYRQGT